MMLIVPTLLPRCGWATYSAVMLDGSLVWATTNELDLLVVGSFLLFDQLLPRAEILQYLVAVTSDSVLYASPF